MKNFYFTFGFGHNDKEGRSLANNYVIIKAKDSFTARAKMFELFGKYWAFQYNTADEAGVYKFNLNCYATYVCTE